MFLYHIILHTSLLGLSDERLDVDRPGGMLPCGEAFYKNLKTARTLVEQVKKSERTPLMTCLLEGPSSTYVLIKRHLVRSFRFFLFNLLRHACAESKTT